MQDIDTFKSGVVKFGLENEEIREIKFIQEQLIKQQILDQLKPSKIF